MSGIDDTHSLAGAQAGRSGPAMHLDVAYTLVSQEAISRRVAELAREIAVCYQRREITILAVLTGSLVFLADLMRHLSMPLQVGVVSVSSYRSGATRPLDVRFTIPLTDDLTGRDVLVLDDILDSGQTLTALCALLDGQAAASVRTCVLLRKDRPDLPQRMSVDFVGFDMPDEFVVGYGLDYDNRYRNLPDICVLKCHAARPAGRPGEGRA